jgi:hypothetical protein
MFVIDAIAEAAGSVFKIIDKFVPDKDMAAKLKQEMELKLLETDAELQKGQQEINKVEAAHKSIFVAGWRPGAAWISVIALFYNYIIYNLLLWLVAIKKIEMIIPPPIPADLLYPLLFGMLGLGAYRSFEKVKGVSRDN